jgi:hypothetical protein
MANNPDPMAPKECPPAPPGYFNIDAPSLTGIAVQVQHGGGMGTDKLGTIGVGVIIYPNGTPRMSVQVKHADGTSLGVTMNRTEFLELAAIMTEEFVKADQVQAAARASEGAKPS